MFAPSPTLLPVLELVPSHSGPLVKPPPPPHTHTFSGQFLQLAPTPGPFLKLASTLCPFLKLAPCIFWLTSPPMKKNVYNNVTDFESASFWP